MAFLPEKTYFEELIANSYDLSNGPVNFQSSDISMFLNFSLHFDCSLIDGTNIFCIEQSNTGSAWSLLSDNYELSQGSSNFIIDKSIFTGKYIRICLTTADSGILTIMLIAKR